MRGTESQGGDSRIRDTTTQTNIQILKGPVLPGKAKYLVWPKDHPNRPDKRKV